MERKVHFAVSAGDTSADRGQNTVATFATMACCWLPFTFQPTSESPSAQLLCREWATDCIVARVSPPQMQTCACFCWTWWGSCQPLSSACWHTSEPSSVMNDHPALGFGAPFYWELTVSHHHIAQASSVPYWSVKVLILSLAGHWTL